MPSLAHRLDPATMPGADPAAPRRAWRLAIPWPLPALLAWAAAWVAQPTAAGALEALGAQPAWAGVVATLSATLVGGACALGQARPWRRAIVALGFPLSSLGVGQALLPAWAWLLALAVLALLYPARSWRDAPWYPTPARALVGVDRVARLGQGARVLDAGCGIGHGLRALRRAYPDAAVEGVEWSRGLQLAAAVRCRFARVRRGDMWADDWGGFDLVYLFQRPESMPRAWAKACRDMRPGTWLVSLAFEVPGVTATAAIEVVPGRTAWLYRLGEPGAPGRGAQVA